MGTQQKRWERKESKMGKQPSLKRPVLNVDVVTQRQMKGKERKGRGQRTGTRRRCCGSFLILQGNTGLDRRERERKREIQPRQMQGGGERKQSMANTRAVEVEREREREREGDVEDG